MNRTMRIAPGKLAAAMAGVFATMLFALAPQPAAAEAYTLQAVSDCDYRQANRPPLLGWLGIPDAFGQMGAVTTGAQPHVTFTMPHGSYDANTKDLTLRTMERFGGNGVWATGYRGYVHFINVNRPTEGYGIEIETPRARRIFEAFWFCMDERFAQDWVVEVHGNSRAANADEIQVATVNVDADTAAQIKQKWKTARVGRYDHIALLIEPVDDIYWGAGSNKADGMLSRCKGRCLHFELPRAMRENGMLDQTADALAALFAATLAEPD